MNFRFLVPFSGIILCCLLLSCDDTIIADNTRVIIQGRVVDQFGNPLSNALVEVKTTGSSFAASTFLIGDGLTDDNGEFNITSLFGYNESFEVTIQLDNSYSDYSYSTNTQTFIPQDFIFDLDTVTLIELSNFSYDLTRVSGDGNTIDFSFNYISSQCAEVFVDGVINENASQCYDMATSGSMLGDDNPDFSSSFSTQLGSEVEFRYTINNGVEMSQILNINNENYAFEFTY
ncbi:carboxypeptidase-like regulatory domain-containing protein [Winogradskyella sp.]|uniref:carboxypeptidase-like regulatory domain-containing protein n=1 Tax=Winogradskyella sp. TaxID=1883156 RepID=UPI0025FDDA0B|nr:carboxypeptidase-like regulatory domain-containing protein [Winogradskyella sp.]